MDRVIRLTTFDEEQARNSALEYWLSRPPEERIAEGNSSGTPVDFSGQIARDRLP
jgi:hypothetical protein